MRSLRCIDVFFTDALLLESAQKRCCGTKRSQSFRLSYHHVMPSNKPHQDRQANVPLVRLVSPHTSSPVLLCSALYRPVGYNLVRIAITVIDISAAAEAVQRKRCYRSLRMRSPNELPQRSVRMTVLSLNAAAIF